MVEIEPMLREANPANNIPDLIVNGIWEAEKAAFYDNRFVNNADTPSYGAQDWLTIARNAAQHKYENYDKAAEDVKGSFTKFICSADVVAHKE